MILDYLQPSLVIPAQQRVMEVIGQGAMRRDQLLFLLSHCIQRARVDQVLHTLRCNGWLQTMHTSGRGEAVYMLTKDGIKQLGGALGRTKPARVTYNLLVSAVLVRCVERFGRTGWAWYNRPEDELWTLRRDRGDSETDIKQTIPFVSAFVRTTEGAWWIVVDDGLHGNRQIHEGCQRWISNIDRLSEPLRRVLFVAPSAGRQEFLTIRVRRWGDPRVTFHVTTVARVTQVLGDTKVPNH